MVRWTTLLVVVTATACATLFNSDIKTVSFSSNPSQAEVLINGVSYGITPISLDIDNHTSVTVLFRKDGYQDVACTLTASVGAGWVILDVLLGLVPVIIDAATGAWKGIDQGVCNVNMVPSLALARDNGWVMFEPTHETEVTK